MASIEAAVRANFGAIRIATLIARGHSRGLVRAAVRSGILRTVRVGWVAVPDVDPAVLDAVRVGGRLTCLHGARIHGLWSHAAEVHAAAPVHSGRATPDGDVLLHWRSGRWRDQPEPVESLPAVLGQVARCASEEDAVATLDSAMNLGRATVDQVRALCQGLPAARAGLFDLLDPTAQSGLESIVRYRLRRLGADVRAQVQIDGAGRVDLVVNDALVIEVDGREHHASTFRDDRARDLVVLATGRPTLRLAYPHVMDEWPLVLRAIRAYL